MLEADQRTHSRHQFSLAQWAIQALGLPEVRLRFRLQGNHLHILCESAECPEKATVVTRFLRAFRIEDGTLQFPTKVPPIYQVILYGRALGHQRPDWVEQIQLSPLSSSQSAPSPSREEQSPASTADASSTTPGSGLLVSHRSLARSGSPEAIARYLSENLSYVGVSVKVSIQQLTNQTRAKEQGSQSQVAQTRKPADNFSHPSPAKRREAAAKQSSHQRLWVLCESNYSPDTSLLAEPVAQQLRDLKLQGFHDAVICSQVSGEANPDWLVRVDLTPPEEMLREWGYWGDVQAITRLLNQALIAQRSQVRAVLKDSTLHLFCSLEATHATLVAPDKPNTMALIAQLLKNLAPQGIHAATVYGVLAQDPTSESDQEETPHWVDWLNLPAGGNPALAESAWSLGQHGDLSALQFLLQRLLNSDLDQRLATGGVKITVCRKRDLLHVMSEALLCPQSDSVGPPVARFLRQLGIPGVTGVRVYGRRAGQSAPLWNYGIDFVSRKRVVPEATPEFAASDAYLGELLTPTGEPILRPDLTGEDLKVALQGTGDQVRKTLQRWLCASQLFVPTTEVRDLAPARPQPISTDIYTYYQGVKVALVWGLLGFVVTVQMDWLLPGIMGLSRQASADATQNFPSADEIPKSPTPATLPNLSLKKSKTGNTAVFNSSGFTKGGNRSVIATEGKNSQAAGAAILAAARSSNPSFNNRLLDEKLALYQQLLLQGSPPDILIVGSSRAMRGIDPAALEDALAAQGYPNVKIFNFGINGATAQVIDLLVRQILSAEQLPKLIIWADGVRAFNSGSSDLTYNAITTSKGYQQLRAGTFPTLRSGERPMSQLLAQAAPPTASGEKSSESKVSLAASYQAVNSWLNEKLAGASATYPQREQMATRWQQQLAAVTTPQEWFGFPSQTRDSLGHSKAPQASIDFNGFLPLSVRFNPATYYKKYARVSGDYDSDYEFFQLSGRQTKALEELLKFSQVRQVPIVFVNLPLNREYLDSVRTEYEQEFKQYMVLHTLKQGLIFRDLSQLWPNKHDYFSDPSHLNRYGADQVSNQLAQDALIPWSLVRGQ